MSVTTGAAGTPSSQSKQPPNTVVLDAGGRDFVGWQTIRITRRLEGCPNDFEIGLSEKFPFDPTQLQIKPGDPCIIKIGPNPVITGYVDRVMLSVSPTGHAVRVMGRGKCQDLVDCSISGEQLHGMGMTTTSLLDLAKKLSAVYSIDAVSLTGNNVPVSFSGGVPVQFNAILTETPFEIIERVARFAGVLVYEGVDGNLVLANVGTGQHPSGFGEGVNVQAASVAFSMDQRFSDYLPTLLSVNMLGDQDVGGISFPVVKDIGVPRFRQIIIVSEQNQLGQFMAELRARWEKNRRIGRSQAIRLTCDTWRDANGRLWEPNFYAPVNLPALKIVANTTPFVISEVTYSVEQGSGTTADIVLMPEDAFTPEPIILRPDPWNPTDPRRGSGGAAGP